jgi:hypothetical protein
MNAHRSASRRHALLFALFLGVVTHTAPARAGDPLLMFVLGFAKNLLDSSISASKKRAPEPAVVAPLPPQKHASAMTEADLRALADASFTHLTAGQRRELVDGLERTLADPANNAHRESIIHQFVNVARQIQFTQAQLNRLSSEQKQGLAEQFAANFRQLSSADQHAVLEQLRARTMPVPADLNEMMLTALATAR